MKKKSGFYCEECDEKAKIMIKDNLRLQHCNKMSYFVAFKVVLFMAGGRSPGQP